MDKYEYKVKLAQIEKLVAKKDYVTAAKIADGIDWRKVKSVTTLNMVADIYEATNRLEDCYEILNMVYDRSPVGRRVVYRMTEIATKMHDFEEAIDLYKEFVKIAPRDLSKYILKYQIYRERGSSVTDQITILEEYKSYEYDERWAYELACLYEEAGMIDRCIEECDELILWFSEGEYVAKAMELKMKYQELTASQQEKYEHRFDYLEQEAEDVVEETEEPKKDKKDEQIADLTDKLTRQMAEFDNFRKRTEKEKAAMYEIGAKDVIEKILPVVDNFERGFQGVSEEEKENPFIQGMDKIYKQMMTVLEGLGVKPIEAVGQEFNPDFHNAVMHVEDEEVGENIVVEEFLKGYMYRDSVVRYSMVKVAN